EAKGTGRAHRLSIRSSSEIHHWFKQLSFPHLLRSAAPAGIVSRCGGVDQTRYRSRRKLTGSLDFYGVEQRLDGHGPHAIAGNPRQGPEGMQPEPSITLELRLVKPLVRGRLVGKFRMQVSIGQNVARSRRADRWFYVKELAGDHHSVTRARWVANRSDHAMHLGEAARRLQSNRGRIDG